MDINKDKFYSVREVADILGLTIQTIRNKCKAGDIKCSNIKSGKYDIYRVSGESILNLLNK